MLDNDLPAKEGLPPRDRNADVPEHANGSTVWIGGAIAVAAVLALVMLGSTGSDNRSASTPNLNSQPGTTTGAAPSTPPKGTQ